MQDLHNHPRTPKQYLRLYMTGIAMGIADLVPGVSGGTMAFILGVYEDLLNAIKSISLDFFKRLARFRLRDAIDMVPWQFLLALGLGIISAIVLLANVMSWLWDNERVFVLAFFFGLVLASILAIGARLKWSALTVGTLAAGTVVAFIIVNLIPLDMPHDPLTLFFSGMVAITAMILPGISGSFILLILGQYDFVLNAVKGLDIISVAAVAAGCAVGILGFARVLSWLLNRYEQPTVAALVGFMLGSLYKLWPWKEVLQWRTDRHGEQVPLLEANMWPDVTSQGFWVAVGLCLLGFLIVSLLDHLQSKDNPLFRIGRGRRAVVPASSAKR